MNDGIPGITKTKRLVNGMKRELSVYIDASELESDYRVLFDELSENGSQNCSQHQHGIQGALGWPCQGRAKAVEEGLKKKRTPRLPAKVVLD